MDGAANESVIDEILSRLTPDQVVDLRVKLGPLCLWCGAEATLLCDGRLAPLAFDLTCDAPVCPACSSSMHIRGHMHGPDGGEAFEGTIDDCPACVARKAARERCDHRTPERHGEYVREHAAAHPVIVSRR